MNSYYRLIVLALCLSISACTYSPFNNCSIGQNKAIQDSIYFGTEKLEGHVTENEWLKFIDTKVTPHFPEGFTVTTAAGQWKRDDGIINKERSYILTIVHFGSDNEEYAINDIINTYKKQFQQEAVLRVTNEACISF